MAIYVLAYATYDSRIFCGSYEAYVYCTRKEIRKYDVYELKCADYDVCYVWSTLCNVLSAILTTEVKGKDAKSDEVAKNDCRNRSIIVTVDSSIVFRRY